MALILFLKTWIRSHPWALHYNTIRGKFKSRRRPKRTLSQQASQRITESPIVWSGFGIGIAAPYPATSIERDFSYTPHHPAAEAYYLYNPPPHNRPTWDLTSALYAVASDRGYFSLSSSGRVDVEADGFTRFTPSPGGRDRFLILNENQVPRLKEALVQLASEPPTHPGK